MLLIGTGCSQQAISEDEQELFKGYTLIQVYGGDLSGEREPNVVVDVGFGERKYYAFTNEYGQLIKVVAKEIVLQDDKNEPVLSSGRYYPDEAKVPGTESKVLDEGHVIADSLGGVANAYNITPQDSTLNRHGDQAYMEQVIRDARGCTEFEAIITYSDTETMIPDHYSFTYTIRGNVIHDEFDNINPELGITNSEISITRVDRKKEEVDILNISNGPINLEGYTLVSVKGNQRYIFETYILEPQSTVTVYSKGGEGQLEWSADYIWNNDWDVAELYDPQGNLLNAQ
jgi:hypothetical protein